MESFTRERDVLDMEEWRAIAAFPLYEVSNHGRVRRIGRDDVLYQQISKGYHVVCLCQNNRKTTRPVARLVAEAFLPNPDNKPQVDHRDRVRGNNHVDNLRWVTAAENQANRGVPKHNTSGEHYIRVAYCVSIVRDGKTYARQFSTLEEAKEYRASVVGF